MASNTSSLFGGGSGLGSTANQRPNLFGSTSNATSTFGNTSAAPTQSAQTSSLFGQSQAQTQQPAQSSLFGQSQAQPQQPAQSSLLGQTQPQANTTQAPGQSSTQATQPAFFNSLLERGKKRPLSATVQSSNFEDVPSLQLGLDDIRRKARDLGKSGIKDPLQNGTATKAHYLLASSGVSPGRALRDLKSLDPQASMAPVREPETFDPDNQRFLRNIQQRGRQVMINESLARAQRDFDAFLEEKVDMDWEEQRQKIFQHFGLSQKDAAGAGDLKSTTRGAFGRSARQSKPPGGPSVASRRSVFGRSGLDKSVIGTPGTGLASRQLFEAPAERSEGPSTSSPEFRFVREKMAHYAEKVQDLNLARLQGKAYPILGHFLEVEAHAGGDVPQQLFSAYRALMAIVNENHGIIDKTDPGAVRERQFAADYLEESPKSRNSVKLKNKILEGSRKFLEKSFYSEVENAIAKNPREAQLGGIPSTVNKIRAYIRLRKARKDLVSEDIDLQRADNGDHCWVLIFYLLRCGFVEEAATYVTNEQSFRTVDAKFITYLTNYVRDRRLTRDIQQRVNGEYQQRLRNAAENTVDPYRMACYKIIGRCDLSRRRLEGINQSVEDWMWLQFSMAREDDRAEEVAGDIFGLEDIQTDITEIGQRVFTRGQGQDGIGGYGTFFLLQILGGMFEQAVAYLGTYAPVTAVHFAIALAYYGLLRVSDFYTSGEEILSFTVKQYPQINFGYLITQYTREFRTGYVEAAVDYFTLICLNADLPGALGKSQASVCHEALREFILETRDFAKLLGDIRDDGTRIKGIIEQRLGLINLADQEDFLKNITLQAAGVADDKGLITDAVLLYHLAENYDRVIDIINRALSDAIAIELGGTMPKLQPLRPRLQEGQPGPVDPGSSLSLASVDDPVELGKTMISLYDGKPMYYEQIRPINRDSCGLLLRMLTAKHEVEAGRWAPALDCINALGILPLQARGVVQKVRSAAQAFSSLPEMISRNIGHVIMWSIACIGNERRRQMSGPYETEMHQGFAEQLLVMAKDLMIFSGMVKYKLPPKVYEALARAGAEIGAF